MRNVSYRQQGMGVIALILTIAALFALLVLGMQVIPAVTEYQAVKKAVRSIAFKNGADSPTEIRKSFERFAQVDRIESITAQDLDIVKAGSDTTISFSYSKKIHLLFNISLLLDFQGSSTGH